MTATTTTNVSEVARQSESSQVSFFSGTVWILIFLPMAAFLLIAAPNRKPKLTVREFSEANFDEEVLGSDVPVLVHFYSEWGIGDQVMIAQVERIAIQSNGLYKVGFVPIEKNPKLMTRMTFGRFPALTLFIAGQPVFQCEGVFDEADVTEAVKDTIRRHRWEKTSA